MVVLAGSPVLSSIDKTKEDATEEGNIGVFRRDGSGATTTVASGMSMRCRASCTVTREGGNEPNKESDSVRDVLSCSCVSGKPSVEKISLQ